MLHFASPMNHVLDVLHEFRCKFSSEANVGIQIEKSNNPKDHSRSELTLTHNTKAGPVSVTISAKTLPHGWLSIVLCSSEVEELMPFWSIKVFESRWKQRSAAMLMKGLKITEAMAENGIPEDDTEPVGRLRAMKTP